MILKIKDSKGFGFAFWLPTALLKCKFILKKINKHSDTDIDQFIALLTTINKSLKEYIKKNGHFVLVDVKSAEGETVVIKV